jgi:AraC-like DNA-binding protein
MLVQHIFNPFEIELVKTNECAFKTHRNTFFQLAYIVNGEGIYNINENKFDYRPDDLFLLKPMETQYTQVGSTTTFLFIRFNNIYLKAQEPGERHNVLNAWIQKLEYILQNGNPMQGSILRNIQDKQLVKALCEAIIQEYVNQPRLYKELTQQLINTLITVVARNISEHIAGKANLQQSVSLNIIQYIHQHIYEPEKLKAEHLAAHFNISLNYISEYFKKHTSQNLRQYIIHYKLSLIEIRLLHSDMRLNEIAFEFGFADESHLTKTFRKYKGMNPAEFRKGKMRIAS